VGSVQAAPSVGSPLETAWLLLVDLEWVHVVSGCRVCSCVWVSVHVCTSVGLGACVCRRVWHVCARVRVLAHGALVRTDRRAQRCGARSLSNQGKTRLCRNDAVARRCARSLALSLCDARRVSSLLSTQSSLLECEEHACDCSMARQSSHSASDSKRAARGKQPTPIPRTPA
jgi:hypothetical protein